MQTVTLIIPDQYDKFPIEQTVLFVPLPDHWKEFICEGYLEAMLNDFS